jgi:MASE1
MAIDTPAVRPGRAPCLCGRPGRNYPVRSFSMMRPRTVVTGGVLGATAMPQKATRPRRGNALGWLACLMVVFIAWIGLFHASRLLEYAPLASLWFPPAAVSFAAFAVLRWHALAPLMLASLVGSWSTFERIDPSVGLHDILINGLLYGAVHCAAYWLAAEAMLRSIPSKTPPSIARTVAVFLLAGMCAAAVAALGGAAVTAYIGLISFKEAWPLVLPWLIGDYTGLIVMGPLLALALRALAETLMLPFGERLFAFDDLPRPQHNVPGFAMKLVLVLSVVMLSLIVIAQAPHNEPLLFVIFVAVVLQLWIVHTQGIRESLISIALFSLTIVVMVYALGLGQIALTMQFAMITLATGSYFRADALRRQCAVAAAIDPRCADRRVHPAFFRRSVAASDPSVIGTRASQFDADDRYGSPQSHQRSIWAPRWRSRAHADRAQLPTVSRRSWRPAWPSRRR